MKCYNVQSIHQGNYIFTTSSSAQQMKQVRTGFYNFLLFSSLSVAETILVQQHSRSHLKIVRPLSRSHQGRYRLLGKAAVIHIKIYIIYMTGKEITLVMMRVQWLVKSIHEI